MSTCITVLSEPIGHPRKGPDESGGIEDYVEDAAAVINREVVGFSAAAFFFPGLGDLLYIDLFPFPEKPSWNYFAPREKSFNMDRIAYFGKHRD
jgi:hypothetical protein